MNVMCFLTLDSLLLVAQGTYDKTKISKLCVCVSRQMKIHFYLLKCIKKHIITPSSLLFVSHSCLYTRIRIPNFNKIQKFIHENLNSTKFSDVEKRTFISFCLFFLNVFVLWFYFVVVCFRKLVSLNVLLLHWDFDSNQESWMWDSWCHFSTVKVTEYGGSQIRQWSEIRSYLYVSLYMPFWLD